MNKETRILLLAVALFIGQFIVILSLYARYSDAVRKLDENSIEQLDLEPVNPELDSLKRIAIKLETSLDSLQIVKQRTRYKYIDQIKYVYSIKKSSSLDSITTIILYKLDSLDRAGQLNPGQN
jgi:hypothetical protein